MWGYLLAGVGGILQMGTEKSIGKSNVGPLTDTQIRKAKAGDKAYKMPDGRGLLLTVTPAGGKLWRSTASTARKSS
jgi:hypothetical protein